MAATDTGMQADDASTGRAADGIKDKASSLHIGHRSVSRATSSARAACCVPGDCVASSSSE
eukprot:10760938-Prorocentrum_lima.AAC.1